MKVRLSASVAAANWVAPSRPISSTSVAWIDLLGEIGEDQRPGERQRRAQLIAPRCVGARSGEIFAGPCIERHCGSVAAKQSAHDAKMLLVRVAMTAFSASAAAKFERPSNEVRTRNLEAAGRDQGRAGPDPHAAVFRHALRRPFGAAGAGQGRGARPQPERQRGRAAGAAPNGRTSPAAPELEQYRLRDLVAALGKAQDDSRVKAVALDLDGFTGGGQTAIGDLADAVRAVRAAGKPVVAYGVGYTDDSYQLASAASEIWLNPLGAVLIAGPGGSNLYYKGLLDKLGVTANVYRVGTYKSAVEPFIRNDMSPEAKQNYLALDQATLETWRQSVKQARPKANVDLFLKDMNGAVAAAGGDMAKAALDRGPGRQDRRPHCVRGAARAARRQRTPQRRRRLQPDQAWLLRRRRGR